MARSTVHTDRRIWLDRLGLIKNIYTLWGHCSRIYALYGVGNPRTYTLYEVTWDARSTRLVILINNIYFMWSGFSFTALQTSDSILLPVTLRVTGNSACYILFDEYLPVTYFPTSLVYQLYE